MGNISYNTIVKNKRLGEFFADNSGGKEDEKDEDEVL